MKIKRSAAGGACLGLAMMLGLGSPAPVHAWSGAEQHGPVRRIVSGTVKDSNDANLPGAVVYLKDTRTLAFKTFLSDDDGYFHFGQLSANTDYELYAEFAGKRSKSKTISSFDGKNEFSFTLKVDAAK